MTTPQKMSKLTNKQLEFTIFQDLMQGKRIQFIKRREKYGRDQITG